MHFKTWLLFTCIFLYDLHVIYLCLLVLFTCDPPHTLVRDKKDLALDQVDQKEHDGSFDYQ